MARWLSVAKRAAKAAAKDVGLDSVVGALKVVLGQLITAVVIFVGLGELTKADLFVRVAAAAAPFLLFPMMFLIRGFLSEKRQHSDNESSFIKGRGDVTLNARGSKISGFDTGIESSEGGISVTLEDSSFTRESDGLSNKGADNDKKREP